MEKAFLKMKKSSKSRDGYVRAEVATSLAHQIRAIRMQRNWSQAELASHLNTTQGTVSRLEDPSYGRLSLKTLFELAAVFDTGLRVQFVSFIQMLHETYRPSLELRTIPSFEEEANSIAFYETAQGRTTAGHYVKVSHSPDTQTLKSQFFVPAMSGTPQVLPMYLENDDQSFQFC